MYSAVSGFCSHVCEVHLWVGTIINSYRCRNRFGKVKQLAQCYAAGQIQDLNPSDLTPELAILPTELRISDKVSCLFLVQILDLLMHCHH